MGLLAKDALLAGRAPRGKPILQRDQPAHYAHKPLDHIPLETNNLTHSRVHDPRSFQMAEQNRPVYVQQVESQPPQHTVPDGRHVVIVD